MGDKTAPKIEDAPGLTWRATQDGWTASWLARSDLVKKGYAPARVRIWSGAEPTDIEVHAIAMRCRNLQSDLLMWGRNIGFIPAELPVVTLKDVLEKYQTDPDSSYHRKRYTVRQNHDTTLKRIADRHGTTPLSEIKGRLLIAWHKEWSADGQKVAMGHTFIGHLRTIFGFGAAMLEDPECERLCGVMHKMRFAQQKPRTQRLTAELVVAVREKARARGWNMMALAQAIQFDLMLRQKDVIGEYVPLSEPGFSDTANKTYGKWFRGIRWEEVDNRMVLKHTTSKRGKDIEVNLRLAPMVMEELALMAEVSPAERCHFPATGPIIICETSGFPYTTAEFRRKWRKVANEAGVPKDVRNMDSRAGAISEATDAGADLEHVRHAATHSDIGMTQRYSRGSVDKVAGVMELRAKHRNKAKT